MVASLVVRFICSTWPLVHEWLGLVSQSSIQLASQSSLGPPFFQVPRRGVEAQGPGIAGVPVAKLLGELDAVVGQYSVDVE
jgi:hypothetical protein